MRWMEGCGDVIFSPRGFFREAEEGDSENS